MLMFGGVITGGLKSGINRFVPCGADNGEAFCIVLGVIEASSSICATVVVTGLLLANPYPSDFNLLVEEADVLLIPCGIADLL